MPVLRRGKFKGTAPGGERQSALVDAEAIGGDFVLFTPAQGEQKRT